MFSDNTVFMRYVRSADKKRQGFQDSFSKKGEDQRPWKLREAEFLSTLLECDRDAWSLFMFRGKISGNGFTFWQMNGDYHYNYLVLDALKRIGKPACLEVATMLESFSQDKDEDALSSRFYNIVKDLVKEIEEYFEKTYI